MTPEEVLAFAEANKEGFGMTPEEIEKRQKLVAAVAKYDTELARTIASGPYRINGGDGTGGSVSAQEAWSRSPQAIQGPSQPTPQTQGSGPILGAINQWVNGNKGAPAQPSYNPLPGNPPAQPSTSGPIAAPSAGGSGTGPPPQPAYSALPQNPSPAYVNGTIPSQYNYGTGPTGAIQYGQTNNPGWMTYPEGVPPSIYSDPNGGQANKGRYSPRPMGNGTPTGFNMPGMPFAPSWGAPTDPQNMLPQWQQAFIGAPQQGPQYAPPGAWDGAPPPGFMGDARWRMMR